MICRSARRKRPNCWRFTRRPWRRVHEARLDRLLWQDKRNRGAAHVAARLGRGAGSGRGAAGVAGAIGKASSALIRAVPQAQAARSGAGL